MNELVELNNQSHKELKLDLSNIAKYAATQNIVRLRVPEVAKAVTNFPVFFIRDQQHGAWTLSALTHFLDGNNAFVENGQWTSTYQPTSTQSYPFYLMRSPQKDNSYTIGIMENSNAFRLDAGDDVFDANGKALAYLSRAKSILEADIKNDIYTHQFSQKLEELALLKLFDLNISFGDGSVHTLAGLHTIDEDKLNALSPEQLAELSQLGYLIPIHGMLISIYQLNLLMRKHNQVAGAKQISQVKIEVAKDNNAAY